MSDEQEFESKRARQKARRAARLEEEAKAAQAAGTRRMATYGIVGLVVVGLIGLLVFNQIRQGEAEREQVAAAAEKLDELGCTPDERKTDLGGGHISGTETELTAEAPDVIYPEHPPSSGRHIGQVAASGVFDTVIDPRYTTHNLEHGYVVAWYDSDAPADQVEDFKEWGRDTLGDYPKLIVAEYYQPFEGDVNFAYSSWFYAQSCETFDADVADVFTRTHYDTAGEGPEKGIPAHSVGGQGVADPTDEDQLLPPLSASLDLDGGEASPTIDPEEAATE